MKKYYIFFVSLILILPFLIVLFLIFNSEKIKTLLDKQGLANENSEYIYPVIVQNIINDKQRNDIIEYAENHFEDSVVGSNNKVDYSIRNSKTAWIPKKDPIAKDIIQNICNKYNYPFENAEDLQVVKYDVDNYYKEHHDSFPYYDALFLSQGGHRVLTTLIYLNDNFTEGETYFVNLNQKVKPQKNSAVIFHPLDKEKKKCHPKALHAGLPIKSGTKYIANIWIREDEFKYSVNDWDYDYLFNRTILDMYKSLLNM